MIIEHAVFAAGCFWCIEAVYNRLKGVHNATSGYINGHTPAPTYAEVCSGHSGHAEAVKIEFDPEIISYRDWYLKHPKYLNTVTQKAAPYLYLVMQEIDKRDMPMELVLLPIVESAYNPNARSPSNATGLWQFTAGTGRRFGLEQSHWYDGRRDIQASTSAALDYLQKLHDELGGDWFNAVAAYNAGEGRIQKAVDKSRRAGKRGDNTAGARAAR